MKQHKDLSHSEFKRVVDNLVAKSDGNAVEYGLTQDLVDQIKAGNLELDADIKNQVEQAAASKAATTKLKGSRKASNALYAKAKRVAKENGISEAKLVELGFEADDLIKSKIAVFDPSDLVVSGYSNGTNALKWNKNGNKPGTIYNVEAMLGAATGFVIVGTTTVAKFEHKNQKPGVKAVYRVRAQRSADFSDYSNEASVY